MADLPRHHAYDIASTGPDAAVVTTAGYGSDRIAHLRRGEDCSPEAWATFKRWLAEVSGQHTNRLLLVDGPRLGCLGAASGVQPAAE